MMLWWSVIFPVTKGENYRRAWQVERNSHNFGTIFIMSQYPLSLIFRCLSPEFLYCYMNFNLFWDIKHLWLIYQHCEFQRAHDNILEWNRTHEVSVTFILHATSDWFSDRLPNPLLRSWGLQQWTWTVKKGKDVFYLVNFHTQQNWSFFPQE